MSLHDRTQHDGTLHDGTLHDDARATLTRWHAPDPGADALRHALLAFLDARPDACRRTCAPGHLTASAAVLDADGTAMLLTLHPRLGRWVQLGGHCEADDVTLAAAALREATEESGIAGLRVDPEPLALTVHPIRCSGGVPTRHLDVQFLVTAPAGAVAVRGTESLDLRWWPLTALPRDADAAVLALADAAARRSAPPGTG